MKYFPFDKLEEMRYYVLIGVDVFYIMLIIFIWYVLMTLFLDRGK